MTNVRLHRGTLVGAALAMTIILAGAAIPLDAQNPSAQTPNLAGQWNIEAGETCHFANVWDPLETAQCGPLPAGGPHLAITQMKGRVFAGAFPELAGSKITGAIGDDGTVVIQAWIGNNRMFYSGRLTKRGQVLRMEVKGNEFEDWRATFPSMTSGWFIATKVD